MTADTCTFEISRKPWKRTAYFQWNPTENKWVEMPTVENHPAPPLPDPGYDIALLRDQVFALRQEIADLKDALQTERESARFEIGNSHDH